MNHADFQHTLATIISDLDHHINSAAIAQAQVDQHNDQIKRNHTRLSRLLDTILPGEKP